MSTDIPVEWFLPVDDPYPLPPVNGDEWFRVNNSLDLARYERWLAEHGHTLEDETP